MFELILILITLCKFLLLNGIVYSFLSTYLIYVDYVTDQCSIGQMNKIVLPLAFKMLDDTRTEVKQKTEKLVKKLNFLVGN